MGEGDSVTHFEASGACRFGTDDQFIGLCKATPLGKLPWFVLNGFELSKELNIRCDHRLAFVGVAKLNRNCPLPRERVLNGLKLGHCDGIAWWIGVEDAVQHSNQWTAIGTDQEVCIARTSSKRVLPRRS